MLKETKHGKLVRDLVPDVIRANGQQPVVKVLGQEEYITELKKKLVEESAEVLEETSREGLLKELADVAEVLAALQTALGITDSKISAVRMEKNKHRGAFRKKLYLEATLEKEG